MGLSFFGGSPIGYKLGGEMKIPCPFCGEVDTERLEINLWEIHKSLGGKHEYCPKCGRFMNLDHALFVNDILNSVEIVRI